MRIITFSGIDGSGKTTQAKLLKMFISTRLSGKASYVWFRWHAFFSFFPLFIYKILGYTIRYRLKSNIEVVIRIYYLNKALSYLWVVLQGIDILISVMSMYLRARISRTKYIITDRFIIDKIIDLAWETHINPLRFSIFRALLLWNVKLIQRGIVIPIYMHIQPEIALKRKRDIYSVLYSHFYLNLYECFNRYLKQCNIKILELDGEDAIAINFRKILSVILRHGRV